DGTLVRFSAANSLGSMELETAIGVPALVEAISDKESDVRITAVNSLQRLGAKASAAVPALVKAMKSDDRRLAFWSARALGHIAPDDNKVLAELIEALDRAGAGSGAVEGMYALGPKASSAVPALLKALEAPPEKSPEHRERFRVSVVGVF